MLGFAIVDNLIFFLLFAFGIIGSIRGFVKTLLSFVALLVGYGLAVKFFHGLTNWCTFLPLVVTTRSITVFLTLVLAGYFTARIVMWSLRDHFEFTLLGAPNWAFGFWLGALQGLMVVTIATIVCMLSTASTDFQTWISQGMISHSIGGYSYDVANDTKGPTDELQAEFHKEMKEWGIDTRPLEKQFIDGKLMSELVKVGLGKQSPSVAFPPDTAIYSRMHKLFTSDSLTREQKALKFWEQVLSSQNFNIPSGMPSASEAIFHR